VLLGSDEAKGRVSEEELAQRYHLSVRSVERIRKRYFQEGMGMFEKKERKVRSDKKIDGRVEAHLVALVCQGPPEGESKWKLQLLADRLVELQVVQHISSTMVGRLLKKTNYSLSGQKVG
jgi:transposase